MKPSFNVEDLVMHRGAMNLLDSIDDYGDDWLRAKLEVRNDAMFACEYGVPSWLGMEYLAQAIGAFEGINRRLQGSVPKLGFLVGSRKYVCNTDYFSPGMLLTLQVSREMQAENGLAVFRCELTGEGVVATADINVFQPENAEEFLKGAIV